MTTRTAYRTCPLCEATCGLELTVQALGQALDLGQAQVPGQPAGLQVGVDEDDRGVALGQGAGELDGEGRPLASGVGGDDQDPPRDADGAQRGRQRWQAADQGHLQVLGPGAGGQLRGDRSQHRDAAVVVAVDRELTDVLEVEQDYLEAIGAIGPRVVDPIEVHEVEQLEVSHPEPDGPDRQEADAGDS